MRSTSPNCRRCLDPLLRQHEPSTPWEVVLYVAERADDDERARWRTSSSAGPAAPSHTCTVRESARSGLGRARIALEHVATRKRIDVLGYLAVDAEGEASDPGDVQCGTRASTIPGPSCTEMQLFRSTPRLRWEVRDGATPPSRPTSTTPQTPAIDA